MNQHDPSVYTENEVYEFMSNSPYSYVRSKQCKLGALVVYGAVYIRCTDGEFPWKKDAENLSFLRARESWGHGFKRYILRSYEEEMYYTTVVTVCVLPALIAGIAILWQPCLSASSRQLWKVFFS